MKRLILNPQVQRQADAFIAVPSHALMLVGTSGSGKRTLALSLAETILQLPTDGFRDYPYGLHVAPEDGKAIGIESVRKLDQFLALKVPGSAAHDRIIIIEDAHLLSLEAQNAILKLLEEPPAGTILILTVTNLQAVLPTIRSRAQTIQLSRPEHSSLKEHFTKQNFDEASIKQAYAISNGLPGLMHALLHETDHTLILATQRSRQLLGQSTYERLASVDELAKQRGLAIDVTTILQQMAHVSLQTASGAAAKKWQTILTASYDANEALLRSAQPKLALTNLMLSL